MNTTTTPAPHKSSSVRPPSARSTAKRIAGAKPSSRRGTAADTETTSTPTEVAEADEFVAEPTATPTVDDSADAPTDTATDDATPEVVTSAVPTRRARMRSALTGRSTGRVLAAAVTLVAIAGVGLATWFGWEWKQDRDIHNAAVAAQSAAEQYAVSLTSVSADSVDKDFATVLGGATGEFKDMYAKSSAQLRQLLVDNKADAQGKVIESGIQSAAKDKVVVLLFIDQNVKNASTPEPRIDRSRVVMTMNLIDGRWLASKVDLP